VIIVSIINFGEVEIKIPETDGSIKMIVAPQNRNKKQMASY